MVIYAFYLILNISNQGPLLELKSLAIPLSTQFWPLSYLSPLSALHSLISTQMYVLSGFSLLES